MTTTYRTAVLAAIADESPVRILTNGDSLVEGEAASTFANTWRQRLAVALRLLHGIKGAGLGFIPARPYATSLPASASWRNPGTSGTATTPPSWNITPGLKGVRFTATGQTRQILLPAGTAFDFMYLQAAGGGGGVLNVQLNSGTATPVNTNDPGQTYQPSKLLRFTRPGGRGAMTVLTTATSNAGGIFDGVMHYDGDDVGGGVHMFDCSRTGARSNVVTLDDMLNGWPAWQPHAIIDDQVGSNDFLDGANGGADPATVAARLGLRLDKAQSMASQPTYIVMIPWRIGQLLTTIAGRTYQQYIDAVLATIAAHPYAASVKVFDLGAIYPDAASQPWHNADNLHPNDLGHQKIAEAAVAFLEGMDVQTISGTAVATSGASGSVRRITPAAGVAVAASSASGAATARRAVAGVAAGVVAAAGAVTATAVVSGEAAANTAATGSASSVQSISGTAAAVSGASGTPSGDGTLSGSATATSGASGRVASIQCASGTAAATTGASGTLATPDSLAGMAPATTGASGRVSSVRCVSGTAAAISGATGTLDLVAEPVVHEVSGVAVAVSGAEGAVQLATEVDVEIVAVAEHPTRTVVSHEHPIRTITILEAPMDLDPNARRRYRLRLTVRDDSGELVGVAPTDWEASFDGGTTWIRATEHGGYPAWLVAGPRAELGGAVAVIPVGSTTPRVRLTIGEEIEVENVPTIHVLAA